MVDHVLFCDACNGVICHGRSAKEARAKARSLRKGCQVGRKDYCWGCMSRLFPCGGEKTNPPSQG